MFKSMDVSGNVACLLRPSHAAQIRVPLDRLQRRQAVLAIVPDERVLSILLHCEDFSADIIAGRLWFAAGENWAQRLETLFEQKPGLPTPSQFLRPISADAEAFNELIGPSQKIFERIEVGRLKQVQTLASEWKPAPGELRRICLIAPSSFRLWEDAADVLGAMEFKSNEAIMTRFDPDHPDAASSLALATAAANCTAVLAANISRSDAAGTVAPALPWITWITAPRIPAPVPGCAHDQLLLAEASWQERALAAGWSPGQILLVAWPGRRIPPSPGTPGEGRGEGTNFARDSQETDRSKFCPHPTLSRSTGRGENRALVLANVIPLSVPARVSEYSSHRLLWEFIENELLNDPFRLTDIEDYLSSRRDKFQIAAESFDSTSFIDRLIVPAFQQGIVRLLLQENIPLEIHGTGWDAIDEFRKHSAGPVRSRCHLRMLLDEANLLIHLWPWQHAHPIESIQKPLIRAFGRTRVSFLKDVRSALDGNPPQNQPAPAEPISPALILQTLLASR